MNSTDWIMMVRPKNFGYNPETAANNVFQKQMDAVEDKELSRRAMREFDALAAKMEGEGIRIWRVEDTEKPVKTDAVFPNNWISTHADGRVVVYPMFSPNRRRERRMDVVERLQAEFGYREVLDLSYLEAEECFLEGTGSMILDRDERIVYACLSPRTHPKALDIFCREMGYRLLSFDAVDKAGVPVYHTNVIMGLGSYCSVICLESIPDQKQRAMVENQLVRTGKSPIPITFEQVEKFAGNVLEVKNTSGNPYLVMSSRAFQSLHQEQIDRIQAHTPILHSDLQTIETLGGGSARCMLAELFLPDYP